MSNSSKVLLSNAFCLSLCAVIAINGHPWFALVPLLGMSWLKEHKP